MAMAMEVMTHGQLPRDSNIVSRQPWTTQLFVNVVTWLTASKNVPDLQIEDQKLLIGRFSKSSWYEEFTEENCTTCRQAVELTAKRIKVDKLSD